MNFLYHISQTVNNNYNTYDSAVVCAANTTDAKNTHPCSGELYSHEKEWEWLSNWAMPEHVTAVVIGEAKSTQSTGVVCASFNAG